MRACARSEEIVANRAAQLRHGQAFDPAGAVHCAGTLEVGQRASVGVTGKKPQRRRIHGSAHRVFVYDRFRAFNVGEAIPEEAFDLNSATVGPDIEPPMPPSAVWGQRVKCVPSENVVVGPK